jgi:hypothetical protein
MTESRGRKGRRKGGRKGGREGVRTHLVLLVLRDEVVHVALGLRELHLVHALARVPARRKEGRKGEKKRKR